MENTIPTLETERLILRGVTINDSDAYQKYFSDFDIIGEMLDCVPWPYPEDAASCYLENEVVPNQGKNKWVWGIFLKSNPLELIGCIDLWRPGNPQNRGFWLGRDFWGNGYMTEAVDSVNDCAFNCLNFETMIFANAVGNIRSKRIKEKTGAVFLYQEPAKYNNPEYTMREFWELKKEDWLKFKAQKSK